MTGISDVPCIYYGDWLMYDREGVASKLIPPPPGTRAKVLNNAASAATMVRAVFAGVSDSS